MPDAQMSWVDAAIFRSEAFKSYAVLLPGIDWDSWNRPNVKSANVALMRRKSSLHFEIGHNPGGWVFPEKIYIGNPTYVSRAPEHSDAVDRLIMQQPMCRSLAVRFNFISRTLLPRCIVQTLDRKDTVRVGSFGSGTGRDVLETLSHFGDNVTVDCYDVDERALVEGRAIAKTLGLHNRVNFINADLTKVSEETYDIGLLVGIICPLPDALARRVVRAVGRNCADGVLLISSSSERMRNDDPFSRFMIEYSADWFLQFRDAERMNAVVTSAGLEIIESTAEPSGFNRLVVAKMNSVGR